jgi:hypothetical protein
VGIGVSRVTIGRAAQGGDQKNESGKEPVEQVGHSGRQRRLVRLEEEGKKHNFSGTGEAEMLQSETRWYML